MPNKKEAYLEYLKSNEWKEKRLEVIKLYKTCVLCNSNHSFHVHHRKYTNLGKEDLNKDVVLLCSKCHGNYHRFVDKKSTKKKRVRKKQISGFTLNQRLLWKETQERYKKVKRAKKLGQI